MKNLGKSTQNCNRQNIRPTKDPPSNSNPYAIPLGD